MNTETVECAMPFEVKDCALVAVSTGKKAQNLRELRDGLMDIHVGSIYFHFWGGLLRPRFDDPHFNNDFASWAHRALNDDYLAERLGVIDPTDFEELEMLRQELIDVIEQRLDEVEPHWARPDHEFHFTRSQTVVFDTRQRICAPSELGEALIKMSLGSIFYHFVDARRRRPRWAEQFHAWLAGLGDTYQQLCQDLASIDPYFLTLTELRQKRIHSRQELFSENFKMSLLESYAAVTGDDVIDHLRQLGTLLKGIRVVHVNSTRVGGGVAEMLSKLVPLATEVGLEVRWEVIHGEDKFYECTKKFHNALQGKSSQISDSLLSTYRKHQCPKCGRAPECSGGSGHSFHSRSPAVAAAEIVP